MCYFGTVSAIQYDSSKAVAVNGNLLRKLQKSFIDRGVPAQYFEMAFSLYGSFLLFRREDLVEGEEETSVQLLLQFNSQRRLSGGRRATDEHQHGAVGIS